MMYANDMPIQPLMNVFGRGTPFSYPEILYPPAACCIVNPSSVHAIAVSSVMVALMMNSSLTALHAKPIAGPVCMKIGLLIISTLPTIMTMILMLRVGAYAGVGSVLMVPDGGPHNSGHAEVDRFSGKII